MGSSIIQPSFTGGELSPSLYGRVDLARYQTSLRTLRNMISLMYGGATNRSGFRFLNEVKTSGRKTRLIPFQFSTVQTYVIEVGHLYMRFYMNGGIIESSPGVPYEIATPYDEADIFDLKFTQSADVMTICHNDYAPRQLSRTGHAAWSITTYPNVNGPFQDLNALEGLTIKSDGVAGVVTLNSSGFAPFLPSHAGVLIYLAERHIDDVRPWAAGQINLPVGTYRRSDGKVYVLSSGPSAGGSAGYRNGGNRPAHDFGSAWDGDGSIESTGTYAEGVRWDYVHSGFGIALITGYTSASQVTALVLSRLPGSIVSSGTYAWAFGAWGGDQGYPACVTYHQERQVFGASKAQPQAYWLTKTGSYYNFGTSNPSVDDDAISKTVPGRQVNAIRHLLPIDDLIIMTSGAEFKMLTNENGVVTPSSATAKPQTYNGSSHLPPIIVGDTALYVQEKGGLVRDMAYTYDKDKFTGNDLTALASHLFAGHTLVDWAYSQVPMSVVWAVRDDGILLGLTYLKEQQVVGWHRHDTDGKFESVCCISEGKEDALYAVVQRTINGVAKRYVERLETRQFTSVEDAFFVDSGLTYDGRDQVGTLTLSGGTAWDHTETLTATLSGAAITLSSTSEGDAFVLTDSVDPTVKYRLEIVSVTSGSIATVRPNRLLPADKRGANTAWDYAILDVGGLSHLEGKTVSILTDGSVHAQRTVSSGVITLQEPAAIVHVGLPIEADFETLDLNVPQGETIRDKEKNIPAVRLIVQDTRGLLAGPDPRNLYELKQREYENYDEPTNLLTGLAEILVDSNWNKQGRIFARQSDPLPVTILAAIPEATVAGA